MSLALSSNEITMMDNAITTIAATKPYVERAIDLLAGLAALADDRQLAYQSTNVASDNDSGEEEESEAIASHVIAIRQARINLSELYDITLNFVDNLKKYKEQVS